MIVRLALQLYLFATALLISLMLTSQMIGTLIGGDVIAFTSDRDGDSDIYAMDIERHLIVQLTHNNVRDDYPSWSPDGSRLLFNSWMNAQNSEVFMMDATGRNMRRLTRYARADMYPSWSTDGSQILFSTYRPDGFHLFMMDTDGANLLRLPDQNVFQELMACLSPDGSEIVFTDRSDILVMNHDGTNLRRVTNTLAVESQPQWSRDGSKIVFVSEQGSTRAFNIFVVDADGSNIQRLTSDASHNQQPQFSLDDSTIVFASGRGADDPRLYLMNPDGSNVRLLDTQGTAWSPAWMP
jgi:Tol biopolymer transport system component